MAKPLPKHALGIGRLRAHLARKLLLTINHRREFNHIGHRLWTPTPDPSPQGGGEKRRRRVSPLRRSREILVRAVAQRHAGSALAGTEEQLFGFRGGELDR